MHPRDLSPSSYRARPPIPPAPSSSWSPYPWGNYPAEPYVPRPSSTWTGAYNPSDPLAAPAVVSSDPYRYAHYASGYNYPWSTYQTAGHTPRSPHRPPLSPSPCTAEQNSDRARIPKPTAGMSTDYQDYLDTQQILSRMTVDRLKRAIRGLNSSLHMHMRVSGKKNDLYTALRDTLGAEYAQVDKSRFRICVRYINEAKTNPNPNGPTWNLPASGSWTSNAASTSGYGAGGTNGYGLSQSYGTGGSGTNGYGDAGSNGSGSGAYGGYGGYNRGYGGSGGAQSGSLPAPRFGGAYAAATTGTTPGAPAGSSGSWQNARSSEPPIRFRPSPFYRVEKALSSIATLIKAGQGDRKVANVNFTLSQAQLELLRKSKESKANPQYQVRLYCTSDTNYNQVRPQAVQFPAPIEFPAACEVKLNGVTVPANTKGIKKQPGTAPPVNLSAVKAPSVQTNGSGYNSVDLVYTNTDKVYYIVAYLVEYTPIEKIVNRVKAGKFRPKEEVIEGIIKLNEDPDVEASAFGLSLKDPLSYARIDTPVRSVYCNHIACFDAVTWFEMNEQTPQWQCPICNKTLKVEDMLVDGYFEDILRVCSSAVDSVTVEPDGTWRSDNDKFGTAKPKKPDAASAASSMRNSPAVGTNGGGTDDLTLGGGGGGDGNQKPTSHAMREALTLDLDDSDTDEGRTGSAQPLAKRARLNGMASFGTGSSATPNGVRTGTGTPVSASAQVLDLTLSSDEDEEEGGGAPAQRPSLPMARTGSSEQKARVSDVRRDVAAMHERMRRDYGENWQEAFPLGESGLPSPAPGQ